MAKCPWPTKEVIVKPTPPHHFAKIDKTALARVPRAFHHWIADQSSLTQRLIALSSDQFKVRLLNQGVEPMQVSEALALGDRIGAMAIVREVELLCEGQACVYARSVIPLKSLKGKQRRLASLGTQPLGAFLFADPKLKRAAVDVLPLDKSRKGWGRRSLFMVGGYPIFVSEYFLPSLIEYERNH